MYHNTYFTFIIIHIICNNTKNTYSHNTYKILIIHIKYILHFFSLVIYNLHTLRNYACNSFFVACNRIVQCVNIRTYVAGWQYCFCHQIRQ